MNKIKDGSIDFILVDGRKRDILSLAAIDKLKPGGLLILDNAERYLPNNFDTPESIGSESKPKNKTWKLFNDKINDWRQIWTSNGVTTTLILFKP